MTNAKRELYASVDTIRTRFGIPFSSPLDAIALIEDYTTVRLYYRRFSTPGLCAAAFAGNDHHTIILDGKRSYEEQNFDCAHEIVHLTRHVSSGNEMFQCFGISQNNYRYHEWEANEGSAQMLVPYQDFIPRFLRCLDYRQHQNEYPIISELAKYYFVSEPVIGFRIDSLGYEIEQYRCGIPIESIELLSKNQRRLRGINPPPYKAMCYFNPCVSVV